MMFSLNLNLYSKYRTELMGVATLLIIICHSPVYITMPNWLSTLLSNGGAGCDVFLFLSGMGMYNSYVTHLGNGNKVISWYWKRYMRLVVPCAFVIIGSALYSSMDSVIYCYSLLLNLSGFYYLTGHLALWYVACTLLLYIITPLIHEHLIGKDKWYWLMGLSIVSLIFWYINWGESDVIHNWQFCISRFPSYFIGYALAKDIKEKKEVSVVWLIVVPLVMYFVFFVSNHTIGTNFSLFWTQGIPIMTVSALFINWINSNIVNKMFSFLGSVSLESYATNVLVVGNFSWLSYVLDSMRVNQFNISYYVLGSLICLLFSYVIDKVSIYIVKKIS